VLALTVTGGVYGRTLAHRLPDPSRNLPINHGAKAESDRKVVWRIGGHCLRRQSPIVVSNCALQRGFMQRIKYLDGWRGCAVLAVLFAHFATSKGINFGRFGVELFFVLSGRLMAEILFIKNIKIDVFFFRRFSRVYPALLVFTTACFIVQFKSQVGISAPQYLSAITFTANYGQFWWGRNETFDHIWSLCVEEHAYIMLGAMAWAHRRYSINIIPVLIGICLICITIGLVQTLSGMDYYSVYWRSDVRGASILIGVIAYLLLHKNGNPVFQKSWLPLVLGGGSLLLNINVVPDPIKYSFGTIFLASCLVLLKNSPKNVLQIMENKLLLRVGVWSYSIYLWQQPFAKIKESPINSIIYFIIAISLAMMSFYLVEQPARRILNRLVAKRGVSDKALSLSGQGSDRPNKAYS